jgi:hypothetical protein
MNRVSSVEDKAIDVMGELNVVFYPISILISNLLPTTSYGFDSTSVC